MKEQKQPAKTTIVSKKVAKKVQFSQKNWEIGQPSQTIWFFVYRNPSEASTKLIGGFYETSQIFVHAEMITSNDQKRDHTGWAMARGTCVEIGKTTAHRKRYISKSTTFPTAAYQPYAKNNRKSPVSKQQFFSKKLAKKVQFSQKNGEIGQRSQTIWLFVYHNPSEASTKLLKFLHTLRWSLQTTKSAITLDELRQEERNLCRDWKNHSTQGLCVMHRDIRYSVYCNPSEAYKKLK